MTLLTTRMGCKQTLSGWSHLAAKKTLLDPPLSTSQLPTFQLLNASQGQSLIHSYLRSIYFYQQNPSSWSHMLLTLNLDFHLPPPPNPKSISWPPILQRSLHPIYFRPAPHCSSRLIINHPFWNRSERPAAPQQTSSILPIPSGPSCFMENYGLMPLLSVGAAAAGLLSHIFYFIHGEHHNEASFLFALFLLLPPMSCLILTGFWQLSFSCAAQLTATTITSYLGALWTSMIIYRSIFHRLHPFPGPPLARTSKFYHCLKLGKMDNFRTLAEWHEEYGDFVRVGMHPTSDYFFRSLHAWRDRNGLRTWTFVILIKPSTRHASGYPSFPSIHRKWNFLIESKASPYVRYPLWGVKLMFYINSNWSFVAVLFRSHLTSPRASNYGGQGPRNFQSFPQTPQPPFLVQTHLVTNRHGTIMAQSPYRPYVLSKNTKLGERSGIALLAPKVRMHPPNQYCCFLTICASSAQIWRPHQALHPWTHGTRGFKFG